MSEANSWCLEIWQCRPELSLTYAGSQRGPWQKRGVGWSLCSERNKWKTFQWQTVFTLYFSLWSIQPTQIRNSLPICKLKEGHRLNYVLTAVLILISFNCKTFKGAAPESWVLLVPHCKTLEALSPEEQTAERTKKNAWPREGSRQYDKQEVSIWRAGTTEEGSLFWIQYLLQLTHEDPRAHFRQRAFSQLFKE